MSYSAGILPVSSFRGDMLVLLGRDRSDGLYSDFGGRVEPEDGDEPKSTARREMFEESNGAIIDWDAITRRLSDDRCHTLVQSRTMGHAPYYMHIMFVPFVQNYDAIFQKTNRFLWHIDAKRRYLEKDAVSWFFLSEVIAAAGSLGGGARAAGERRSMHLRDVFAATIRGCTAELQGASKLQWYPSSNTGRSSPYGAAKGANESPRAIPGSTRSVSDPGSPSTGGEEDGFDSWSVSL